MKTVEDLIKRVRRETRNATTGSTTAGGSIKDAEFIDKLNDAQEDCVELISGVFSTLFERVKVYTIDTSQENYEILSLPDNLLLNTRIVLVEYSYSGRDADYVNVPPVDIRERYSGTHYLRTLTGYILTGDRIILSDRLNNNGAKVRVTYEIAPPRLDVVKASVLTGSRSGVDFDGTFTTPSTVDTDGDGTPDAAGWDVGDLVTVIDSSNDTVLIRDAVLDAYSYGAGTFELDITNATYVEATVDAATATNLRLIEGGRTNICELPDNCERYLVHSANLAIFERDGSSLMKGAEKRLGRTENSLRQSYISASKDWPAVPEMDW